MQSARQQFGIHWPLKTHWRRSTCKEVRCIRYETGFRVMLDESVPKHADAAGWIRHKSGMRFTESVDAEGLTAFAFPAGQECFEGQRGAHRSKLDRPEVLTHSTPTGTRTFQRGSDWNESMNEEMYSVERALERR